MGTSITWNAVVELYVQHHTYRMLPEDHLHVSLEEFLGVTNPETEDTPGRTEGSVSECEAVLRLKRGYLEVYPTVVEDLLDGEQEVDLDAQAERGLEEFLDIVEQPA